MKNKKTKSAFPARILTLLIVALLTFWLIPSNLVFADEADTIPPVITLNGESAVYIVAGSGYTDAGATATDNIDGDLTGSIAVANNVDAAVAGKYTVTYNVSDAAGNPAVEVTRTVVVKSADTTPPVIIFNGESVVYVVVGSDYTDAGATATDNIDGDLTGSIVVANNVDISVVGSYTVSYNVSDKAGNPADTIFRSVNVVEPKYNSTLKIEAGEWTTNEFGESGQQTYFSVSSDAIGQQYRFIISGTGSIFPSSFGDTTGFITDTTWYHVCNFSVIASPGKYTATLYIGNDQNGDNILDPGEASFEYSENFAISEQNQGSGTLDVSPGISGSNTAVSVHGINAQDISILVWIFKFDGTWEQLLQIGNESEGNEVFQYLVYGTIPDFDSEDSSVDFSQLEGFFTIDSNDWYKDINVILQQGHYFAIVFPILENTSPEDFLVREFSVNNGVSAPVPILSTDKEDYRPEEIVPISGTGFLPNAVYTIIVTRPDGSIVTGDGSFRKGSDTISADNYGNFTYSYKLDGIEGKYRVRAVDSAGKTVAETDFTDSAEKAASSDFTPASDGIIKDLAFTGVDPIMPVSGAAAAITGLILILISLRKRQYAKWKHSIGYYSKDEA